MPLCCDACRELSVMLFSSSVLYTFVSSFVHGFSQPLTKANLAEEHLPKPFCVVPPHTLWGRGSDMGCVTHQLGLGGDRPEDGVQCPMVPLVFIGFSESETQQS